MGANLAVQDSGSSRDRILDVAEELFARRGYSGVGMREVAAEVGLGKSSLFHHFSGKVELYLEVLNRVLERIHVRLRDALAAPGCSAERLDRGIDALIDGLVDEPSSARLLLRALFEDENLPPGSDQLAEHQAGERTLQQILGDIHELIREGVKSGEFRSVSAAHTIQTIIGATAYHFASGEFGRELIGSPLLDPDAVASRRAEVKAMLHHGLVAREPVSGEGGKE